MISVYLRVHTCGRLNTHLLCAATPLPNSGRPHQPKPDISLLTMIGSTARHTLRVAPAQLYCPAQCCNAGHQHRKSHAMHAHYTHTHTQAMLLLVPHTAVVRSYKQAHQKANAGRMRRIVLQKTLLQQGHDRQLVIADCPHYADICSCYGPLHHHATCSFPVPATSLHAAE